MGEPDPIPVGLALAPDIAQGVDAAAVFNTGGPSSRTRKETIRSSLFGGGGGDGCQLGARKVGGFWLARDGVRSLRDTAYAVLGELGFDHPDQACQLPGIPLGRLHCRPVARETRPNPPDAASDPSAFLVAALVLGKCCNGLYDPARPAIWTEGRLSQCLELFEIGGTFYG